MPAAQFVMKSVSETHERGFPAGFDVDNLGPEGWWNLSRGSLTLVLHQCLCSSQPCYSTGCPGSSWRTLNCVTRVSLGYRVASPRNQLSHFLSGHTSVYLPDALGPHSHLTDQAKPMTQSFHCPVADCLTTPRLFQAFFKPLGTVTGYCPRPNFILFQCDKGLTTDSVTLHNCLNSLLR